MLAVLAFFVTTTGCDLSTNPPEPTQLVPFSLEQFTDSITSHEGVRVHVESAELQSVFIHWNNTLIVEFIGTECDGRTVVSSLFKAGDEFRAVLKIGNYEDEVTLNFE